MSGLHCVADIDMYGEFIITMSISAVGLLLIFCFYRIWLWRIQKSAVTADDNQDTERGALQNRAEVENLEDADVIVSRVAKNLCAWLAIGWFFMVTFRHPIVWQCLLLTVDLQVYTILCRTTFQSFACTEIDDGESFHQNE
jgi:hypothetical protein